jgi:hypothetical protein
MNVYNFERIEKCYVCGNIDRNLNRFISSVTSNIKNFEKKEHPKEIERQARLKAQREAMVAARLGGGNLPPFGGRPIGGHAILDRGPRAVRMADIEDIQTTYTTKLKSSSYLKSTSNLDSTYNDSVIIVCGNCGIGTKSKEYYDDVFTEFNKILDANNCFVLFVRGNNDDPSYFENRLIDFEHIKTIPDYSVVALKTYNCLCIGGSVSFDKEWKLSQEKEFGKKLFWENEAPIFNEEELDAILKKFKISCVVTSTSPTFAYPGTNAFKKSKWLSEDKSILNRFSDERKVIDKIYEKIVDCDTKPYIWAYGRFKMNNQAKVNDILFSSMQSYQFVQLNSLFSMFFGVDTSKLLGNNEHTDDNFFDNHNPQKMEAYDHEELVDDLGEFLDEEEPQDEMEIVDEPQNEANPGVAYWDIPRFEYAPVHGNIFEVNDIVGELRHDGAN